MRRHMPVIIAAVLVFGSVNVAQAQAQLLAPLAGRFALGASEGMGNAVGALAIKAIISALAHNNTSRTPPQQYYRPQSEDEQQTYYPPA